MAVEQRVVAQSRAPVQEEGRAPEQAQRLKMSEVLAFLTQPLPDYEKLATRAKQLHDDLTLRNVRSVEHGLAAYFFVFGRGYAFWEQNYHYNTIHEYFYGAYRLAVHWGGDELGEGTPLAELLLALTRAIIFCTRCENAVIANDAQLLATSAKAANDWAQIGIALCERATIPSADGDDVLASIKFYLTANSYLFRGLYLCAQAHLDDTLALADLAPVEEIYLPALQETYQDLSSELKAHLMIARRYIELRRSEPSEIVVEAPHIYLRAIGFIRDPAALARLFAEFSDDELKADVHDEKRQELARRSRLPISAINKPAIQDIFETALGLSNLELIELDLSPQGDDVAAANGNLVLSVHDRQALRRYEAEFIHLTISRLGSISVDFAFNPAEATVSHLRLLETLLAPHMGDITIAWPDLYAASPHTDDIAEQDTVIGTNFVEQYLVVKDCLEDLPDAAVLDGQLHEWATLLDDLAQFYAEQQSAITIESKHEECDEDDDPAARRQLERWEANYRAQNALIHRLKDALDTWVSAHPEHPICATVQQEVLARLVTEHVSFSFLKDVADRIFKRMEVYLAALMGAQGPEDADEYIWYDYNVGWQSIVSFNELSRRDLLTHRDVPIRDMREVAAHRDYVGLIAGSREARASLDDWRFITVPAHQNLATIRSHVTDLMIVSDNRTLLAFPDDPHYIIRQYEITAQVTANIRAILLGFNTVVKARLSELERKERQLSSQPHEEIIAQRKDLELFRTRTENVLDIIRSYTISKYADHSELLRAMVQDMHLLDAQNALQQNLTYLDHFHAYLAGTIQEHIAQQTELAAKAEKQRDHDRETAEKWRAAVQQRQQGKVNMLLAVLAFISGLGAIDPTGQAVVRIAAASDMPMNLTTVEVVMLFVLIALAVGVGFWLSLDGARRSRE